MSELGKYDPAISQVRYIHVTEPEPLVIMADVLAQTIDETCTWGENNIALLQEIP